jgi:bifunctional non-homologous end joining protein LigD
MSSLRPRTLPAGFIPPCLPTAAPSAPSGDQWWHEIKHDGIRVIARKEDKRVRLFSRPGNDLTDRFPLIVEALGRLRARSCILDGEAVACGDDGIALFELIRRWRNGGTAFMYAFDLIELDGEDLRPAPLEQRKGRLERLLAHSDGIRFSEHLDGDGAIIFAHACKLGHEGIVSKRRDLPYRSGRVRSWIKVKNPASPAMLRIVEEGAW